MIKVKDETQYDDMKVIEYNSDESSDSNASNASYDFKLEDIEENPEENADEITSHESKSACGTDDVIDYFLTPKINTLMSPLFTCPVSYSLAFNAWVDATSEVLRLQQLKENTCIDLTIGFLSPQQLKGLLLAVSKADRALSVTVGCKACNGEIFWLNTHEDYTHPDSFLYARLKALQEDSASSVSVSEHPDSLFYSGTKAAEKAEVLTEVKVGPCCAIQ
ncbi:MAG: hypothetical protein QNK11_06385 [Legionella sp.]|nr:hypothetical protein [Legionella sp.]